MQPRILQAYMCRRPAKLNFKEKNIDLHYMDLLPALRKGGSVQNKIVRAALLQASRTKTAEPLYWRAKVQGPLTAGQQGLIAHDAEHSSRVLHDRFDVKFTRRAAQMRESRSNRAWP